MQWSSTISERDGFEAALAEAVESAKSELEAAPDVILVFPSRHHAADYARLPAIMANHLEGGVLVGCSAASVIGGGREIEERPAIAVIAAVLPDVTLRPFHLEQDDLPDADASPRAWHEALRVDAGTDPHFVLLVDPYSINAEHLLQGLDYAFPEGRKIGGLASSALRPGTNAFYAGNRIWGVGAVGIAMSGDVAVDTIVAQGCRPVGKPWCVTACHNNLLIELDGDPPIERLRETLESLSEVDQELARTSLHLGVLISELRPEIVPGDFLIRNIIGMDRAKGVLAVGERLRVGQTVQFHLRDARTSADDLDRLLTRYTEQHDAGSATGALLFTCLGRGMRLYDRPDHDTQLFRQRLGALPIGGFFCNGEIGPVGPSTYLHGFTSSFGIFRPQSSNTAEG